MKRYISLDVLRGLTIIGMIIANNSGYLGQYSMFRHVSWDGCTVADFVFPFFLFIVGASFWFSSKKGNHELSAKVALTIVKRGLILFAIGIAYNWFPFQTSWENVRIPGVLQRIGFVFIFGGLMCLWLKSYWKIGVATLALLLGYGVMLKLTGYIEPELAKSGFLCTADTFVFGEKHFYAPFDPEGVVSNFSSIANMLIGYMMARFMDQSTNKWYGMGLMALFGGGMILLAYGGDSLVPMNKRLWSPTFVLYTCGWASLLWSFFIMIIDKWEWKKWSIPLQVFGVNALFSYILSYMIGYFSPRLGLPIPMSGLWLVGACLLIAYPLYRYKIYIKV